MFRRLLMIGSLGFAYPAAGQVSATFVGTITNSCTVSLNSTGTLAADGSGQRLSSDSGGTPALLAVVSTGSAPTLSFAAPSVTSTPAGYTGLPEAEISYVSVGGASQEATSDPSSYTSSLLLDTITVNGAITDTDGFVAGSYTLTTVVTCSQ